MKRGIFLVDLYHLKINGPGRPFVSVFISESFASSGDLANQVSYSPLLQ
jgi:hypothetical protein